MKPVLKYRGGKRQEIPYFKQYIPREFDTYIEPFFGGGALFFDIEPSKAIINDVNEKLIDFYTDLKQNYTRMMQELAYLQEIYDKNQSEYELQKSLVESNKRIPNKNEELYYELRKQFNGQTSNFLPGTLYFFINKTAYSGMIRYNKSGEFNVPFGRYKNFNTKLITESHYKLIQNSEIYNTDFSNIFKLAKKNDFIFLDPPYDCTFNDYGNIEFNGGFGFEEHVKLAEEFKKLPCKSMMIISKTDFITDLYKEFILEEYDKNYSVNIRNRFKNDAKHYIITNYLPSSIENNQIEFEFC